MLFLSSKFVSNPKERQTAILKSFGLQSDSPSSKSPDKEIQSSSKATVENEINFLAFVPIELQGKIESVLIFTTGAILFQKIG